MKNSYAKIGVIIFIGWSLLGAYSCNQQQITPNMPLAANPSTKTLVPTVVNVNLQQPLSETDLENMSKDELLSFLKQKSLTNQTATQQIIDMKNSLSFEVRNETGKTIFVTCFYWMKDSINAHWRWDKSKVYQIDPSGIKMIVIDTIPDSRDREWVLGYLGIFDNQQEALDSTFERSFDKDFYQKSKPVKQDLDKNNSKTIHHSEKKSNQYPSKEVKKTSTKKTSTVKIIDLDLLTTLKGQQVVLYVKKYGLSGDKIWYRSEYYQPKPSQATAKHLDFFVENKTGKDLYITCFVYEQPDRANEFTTWTYTKTDIQLVRNDTVAIIKVPEVFDNYKLSYMRGVLGVFDKTEKKIAQDATFELTDQENKISIGLLNKLKGQKIVLDIENYGAFGGKFDYSIKPAAFFNKRSKVLEMVNKHKVAT